MTTPFLSFILAIAFIIAAAKGAGYLFSRLGQPSVLGELLVGIILGPTILDMLHLWPPFAGSEGLDEALKLLAEIGVLLLMLLAGLELSLADLLRSGKVSALAGTLGVIVPLASGWALAVGFGAGRAEAFFLGLTLAATSVSISAQTLMELGVLRTNVGLALLGAAVFDDVLTILLVSLAATFIASGAGSGIGSFATTLLLMVGYLAAASAIGLWVLPRLAGLVNRLPISQGLTAFAVVACLLFAWGAEAIGGMAAITGAFVAGLFLARTPYRARIEGGIAALAYGFFVPVFFVDIGLGADLRGLAGSAWWTVALLTLVAIAGKIGGCGLGGLLGGFNRRDALRLGIGMVSRGEVGLIVAAFAVGQGLMSQQGFSMVIFMVIAATLVTPPLLRAAYAGEVGSPVEVPVGSEAAVLDGGGLDPRG